MGLEEVVTTTTNIEEPQASCSGEQAMTVAELGPLNIQEPQTTQLSQSGEPQPSCSGVSIVNYIFFLNVNFFKISKVNNPIVITGEQERPKKGEDRVLRR